MANKPFEIQGADLTLGGVNLQAGTTGIVIPGVTQATSYRVEEVNDTSFDQTIEFTSGAPVIIDAVTFDDYLNTGSSTGRATYSCEIDDDNFIDDLELSNNGGEYTSAESNINAGADMYAYTGQEADPFATFNSNDWSEIPFRPKMRAAAIENVGGGSGGAVERAVLFPYGEVGDEEGTFAYDSTAGKLYFCIQDYQEPNIEEVSATTTEAYNIAQSGSYSLNFLVSNGSNPTLDTLLDGFPGYQTSVSNPEQFVVSWPGIGERTCIDVGYNTDAVMRFVVLYTEGDPTDIALGEEFTVVNLSYATKIWRQLDNGALSFSADGGEGTTVLQVENNDLNIITQRKYGNTSDCDIDIQAADDVWIRANGDEVGISAKNVVGIETGDGGHQWTFTETGSLQLPYLVNTGWNESYSLDGPTLRLGGENDPNEQVIITGPIPNNDSPSAQRLVIQGQVGYGGEGNNKGEGGDVYIWAGVGGAGGALAPQAGGGDVKVRGGQGGSGGYVKVEGGDATGASGTGGAIEITAGSNPNATGGNGGDVLITAGSGNVGAGGNNGEVHVYTNGTTNHWYFDNGGTLHLPTGGDIVDANGDSVLGGVTEVSAGPLYVVANIDGNIIYSTDGTTFSEAINTGLSAIGTVAVGPNKIVFSGSDVNGDASIAGLFSTSSVTTQPAAISGTNGSGNYRLAQVKYISTAPVPWVAVGADLTASPFVPLILHSTDAITWTETRVNATDLSTFFTGDSVDLRFTDIEYRDGGWLISADRNNQPAAKGGGLWWTTDITQELTTSNFINLDVNFKAVESFAESFYSKWTAFSSDNMVWNNNDTTPETSGSWSTWSQQYLFNELGLSDQSFQESTSGLVSSNGGEGGTSLSIWAVSTDNGHVLYWTNVPEGPFVTIPAPYTATIDSWTSSSTSAITFSGISKLEAGEKFTVTGSSVNDYNGTFYIDASNFVYTDLARTIPFDTTGFSAFTGTATITWSHGEYIDALDFVGGYLYAANDNEEVYRGAISNMVDITWTQVDDKNDSLDYWNDIAYYELFQSSTSHGNITFSGSQIRGVQTDNYFGLIELVPSVTATGMTGDINFLLNGQYVQIYPTNEFDSPHIHIAAGSGVGGNGSLFLGDDNKFVNVDEFGVIRIQAYDSEGPTSKQWSFNADGYFTVPIGGDILEDMTGESLVNGVRRHSLDTGAGTITLAAEHNGKSIVFNGTGGSSNIIVPSNSVTTLPIGYTVTIIMDDFDSNTIDVYGDVTAEAIVNAVGQAPTNNTNNSWILGSGGNVGIYTIMKVNTNRWIISGPDINLD